MCQVSSGLYASVAAIFDLNGSHPTFKSFGVNFGFSFWKMKMAEKWPEIANPRYLMD